MRFMLPELTWPGVYPTDERLKALFEGVPDITDGQITITMGDNTSVNVVTTDYTSLAARSHVAESREAVTIYASVKNLVRVEKVPFSVFGVPSYLIHAVNRKNLAPINLASGRSVWYCHHAPETNSTLPPIRVICALASNKYGTFSDVYFSRYNFRRKTEVPGIDVELCLHALKSDYFYLDWAKSRKSWGSESNLILIDGEARHKLTLSQLDDILERKTLNFKKDQVLDHQDVALLLSAS